MTEAERREYRAALTAMQERTASLDQLIESAAGDLARIRVTLDHAAEQDRRWDEFVAWVHGGPVPDMTPGAQAILTLKGRRNDPF